VVGLVDQHGFEFRAIKTLFSHVGWFHDLGTCQSYFMGLLNKLRIFIYYSYIKVDLEIWVELYSRHYA
jgi:hypothetical protein